VEIYCSAIWDSYVAEGRAGLDAGECVDRWIACKEQQSELMKHHVGVSGGGGASVIMMHDGITSLGAVG